MYICIHTGQTLASSPDETSSAFCQIPILQEIKSWRGLGGEATQLVGLHRHLFLHEVFLPRLLLNVQPLLQVSELSRMSLADLILHPARIEHKLTLPHHCALE